LQKTNYTYNQYGRDLTEETQSWNTGTNQWFYKPNDDTRIVNYYEAYTNDVQTVASNVAEMNVYPVPAKEQITVSATFKQMQPVTISVIDMSGRLVKQLTDDASTQYHKSINVNDLPAGSYILNITGTTEVATRTFSISH
jgi:hypothetical protein